MTGAEHRCRGADSECSATQTELNDAGWAGAHVGAAPTQLPYIIARAAAGAALQPAAAVLCSPPDSCGSGFPHKGAAWPGRRRRCGSERGLLGCCCRRTTGGLLERHVRVGGRCMHIQPVLLPVRQAPAQGESAGSIDR
jgi:hypothetical protein